MTTTTTEEHAGMFGECCAPPLPSSMAEHRTHERGWRLHWGWIDGAKHGGAPNPHAAPDYAEGWTAGAATRGDAPPEPGPRP